MGGVLRLGSIKICPVKLTGEVVIDSLTITPSITTQDITPTGNISGYDQVEVLPVGSYIDNNIRSNNIKNGVTILGVTGNYTGGGGGSSGESSYSIPKSLDTNGKLESIPLTNIGFSGVEDLDKYCFYYMFCEDSNIVSIDFSDLTAVSGMYACSNMFYNCSNLTSVNLSSLTTLSGKFSCFYMFGSCTGLTSVSLPNLTTLSGERCVGGFLARCSNLTSINLSSLTTVTGTNAMTECFYGCTGLTTVTFTSLSNIKGYYCLERVFSGCTSLATVYFPALTTTSFSGTSAFNNMLSNISNCTVHFPSNLQSTLSSWTSVQNGFGGTNTSILFDLPATS